MKQGKPVTWLAYFTSLSGIFLLQHLFYCSVLRGMISYAT